MFEIGSASKVFTSLLLSEMVLDGEGEARRSGSKFLPAGDTMPERAGKQITLIDLATHTSGTTAPAEELQSKKDAMGNPYADYTTTCSSTTS